MIKKTLILFLLPYLTFSQDIDKFFLEKGEIYFSFEYKNKNQLDNLSKIISIDHKTNTEMAYAYANKKEFSKFLLLNIDYKIIKKIISFENNKEGTKNNWNYYPTYQEYTDIMQAFTDSFPNICKLHHLGTLNSGREILIVQISDNVGQKENEPSFLYTSSMHGDELTGYVLMLRLIEKILNGYGTNIRLTNLVNEIDLWINPLANPDGAYAGGNQNVWSSTRYNANWIDLNRNFPDPQDGQHPDGEVWQEETLIFMELADSINFNLSSNLHTGIEVCNYPWDTWNTLHTDDNWWQYVCSEYADTCQSNGLAGYFNVQNNGITNGYNWYEVDGGRQDYMNYFKHGREFTLEVSNDKTPNPNDLPYYWIANYPSLLNYMEQSLYGLRGIITDSLTGFPLKAKVEVIGHDIDSSHVYSSLPIGNYHRYIYQGNYNFTFSKSGYYSKTINVSILNNSTTMLDIQLIPINFVGINEKSIEDKTFFKTIDILGRKSKQKIPFFYIYGDRSINKIINLRK